MITTQERPTVWLNVTAPRLALDPAHTDPPGATEWITTDPTEVLRATTAVVEAREGQITQGGRARKSMQRLLLKLPEPALLDDARRQAVADLVRRGPRVNVHIEVYSDGHAQ